MNKLSEEEIIARIKNLIDYIEFKPDRKYNTHFAIIAYPEEQWFQAIQGLLDLYNKEKEKNKELFLQYEKEVDKLEYQITTMISKDKIRELLQMYDKGISWANADDHYYFVKFIKELLEEE